MTIQNTAAPITAGCKKNYYQMRGIALDNSVSSNSASMERALQVLREFVLDPRNAELVWRSAKVAHSAAGMTTQECIDCLVHLGKKPAKYSSETGRPPKEDPDALDLTKDIYRQLGIQEWVKYLYFGGQRKIGKDPMGNTLYAEDQTLVMHYFGIETEYEKQTYPASNKDNTQRLEEKRFLKCDYSRFLSPMIDLRNKFAGHTNVIREEALTISELMGYYSDLFACLKPLADTRWLYRKECQKMIAKLKEDFFEALGTRVYQVADIMNMMYTNRPDKQLPVTAQPQLEDLLEKAGMLVSGNTVAFAGDLNGFLPALEEAWKYYRLCKVSGIEQLRDWLCEQNPGRTARIAPVDKPAAVLEKGGPEDWAELADRYAAGSNGAERDLDQAKFWYEKAATADTPCLRAMYALGQLCETSEPAIAGRYYRTAADGGFLPAQLWMGIACENGLCGQQRNWKEAFSWYEKASARNDAESLCRLGMCYETGRGTKQDKPLAASYYSAAQSRGSRDAQILGAALQLAEAGGTADRAAPLTLLRTLAEDAVPLAQAKLGECYLNGWGVEEDCYTGYAYARKAAEAGNSIGQYWVGWCCGKLGRGCYRQDVSDWNIDSEGAAEWSLKAALQGHVGAQLLCNAEVPQKAQWLTEIARQASGQDAEEAIRQIVEAHLDGWEAWADPLAEKDPLVAVKLSKWYLDKNISKALSYFELAAQQDQRFAWKLISLYQTGKASVEVLDPEDESPLYDIPLQSSGAINPQRALYWLEKLGHAGDCVACRTLSEYYLEEKTGKKADPERAIYWYDQEGQRGYPKAYCKIAELFLAGKVVERDVQKVTYWYDYAGKHGYHEAYRILAKHFLAGKYLKPNRERAILYYKMGLFNDLQTGTGLDPEQQQAAVMKAIDPYLQPDIPAEVVQAACIELENMAQQNWEQAMVRLGHCYLTRKGLAHGPQEGIRWLNRAYQELGEMDAGFILATIYWEGILVPKDLKRSLRLLEEMAPEWEAVFKNDDPASILLSPQYQYFTGGAYSFGELSFQVGKKGGGWYLVAQCYDKGLGTWENQTKAFEYYRKAWEEGYSLAQDELVRRYQMGIGVRRDPEMAEKLMHSQGAGQNKRPSGSIFAYVPDGDFNKIMLKSKLEAHNTRVRQLKEAYAKRSRGK